MFSSCTRNLTLAISLLALTAGASCAVGDDSARGKQLYGQLCSSCHGEAGAGVAQHYDKPLYGDLSIADLTKVIVETMPEEDPKQCVGEEARSVADYIYKTFYTTEARIKNRPPRIALSRLTAQQFDTSLTDLVSGIDRVGQPSGDPGLNGQYFKSRSYNRSKRAFERTDSVIDFDFQEGTPGDEFDVKEFSMLWNGSVVAPVTGQYEFVIETQNGVKLYVNDSRKMLIDGWVRSGNEPRKLSGRIRLLAGRAYPIKLEFLKYHDKKASIRLLWKPPSRPLEIIPARNLRNRSTQSVFVAKNRLPPDDASFGFARGTSVSKGWDEAITDAAVGAAETVAGQIDRFARTKADDPEREKKIRTYLEQFVERGFRKPLSQADRALFVDAQIEAASSLDEAVRRCVILTVKSPRFLYPDLPAPGQANDGFAVASRISYALWDSMPDRRLLGAAQNKRLLDAKAAKIEVRTALNDRRTRTKMQQFFSSWLQLERAEEMAKDQERFPEFTDELIADLRTSLELFLDDVLWGEDPDYRRLLLSNRLFVNRRISEYYKLKDAQGIQSPEFQPVSIQQQPRSGVVTHPFVLASLAYHQETSPIHRGVFVTRKLLGRRLNPPPEATEFNDASFDPHLSMREKVAKLTGSAQCQSCHQVINPLGFSLENYDAVGQFRTAAADRPINASSQYPSVDGKLVPLKGATDLATYAAQSELAQKGFVRQLFEHLIKQPPAAYGPETLDELHREFQKNNFDLRKLLVDIVTTASLHGISIE